MTLAASIGWLWLVKNIPVKEDVYKYGMTWDSMIVITWYVGSLFIFGMKFPAITWVGIGLFLAGTVIVKITG